MTKNYTPPTSDSKFHFHITTHAVDRFRERVSEDMSQRTAVDLALILDERIFASIRDKKCIDIIDSSRPDENSKAALIESRSGERSYVLLRSYKQTEYPRPKIIGGPAGLGLVAVTLLTEHMGNASIANGSWFVPNRPFAGKLADVTPAEASPQPAPSAPAPKRSEAVERRAATTAAALARLPPGWKSREAREARAAFARGIFEQRPHAKVGGADGVDALLTARFGVSLAHGHLVSIREEVATRRGAPPQTPPPVSAVATSRTSSGGELAALSLQLAEAIQTEKEAAARATAAKEEAAAAADAHRLASSHSESLLAKMMAARG